MKVLLGHLDWGLGTKGLRCDAAGKTFFGSVLYQQCFEVGKTFVKNTVEISVAVSCTITFHMTSLVYLI